MLDAPSLCAADAACRLLRQLNRARIGPWRALGARAFLGVELDREGTFEQPATGPETDLAGSHPAGGRKLARIDWKGRFLHFRRDVASFGAPFSGPEIAHVSYPDEVAYFRCRLCGDILNETCSSGVYLEVAVLVNPDNLSLSIVDFKAGGCSSVTFSPDTGAVIRERKVREAPRKVEGAFIQPLPNVPAGRRFHGLMGLFLYRGRLAFFRRCDGGPAEAGEPGPWETTGFVSNLAWAEAHRLTPCLAFRDEGGYRVRVAKVGSEPPVPLDRWQGGGGFPTWSDFDWEVDNSTAADLLDA